MQASGFGGSWWLYLLAGDMGCLESPGELRSLCLGQSRSCKHLGLISGLPRSESQTWSLDSKFSKSADALGTESGISYQETVGALARLGCCGVVGPESTWVLDG